MNSSERKRPLGDYQVGYGKPPVHTRFRKGQSGNPRGRPRGAASSARLANLVLQEAYRPVTIRVGDKITKLPAIQAIVRSQIALAAKGNGPAQRALLGIVGAIEKTETTQTATSGTAADTPPLSDLEVARRLAFILEKGRRQLDAQKTENDPSD